MALRERDSGARGPGNCLPVPVPACKCRHQGWEAASGSSARSAWAPTPVVRACVYTSVCARALPAPSHQPPNQLIRIKSIFPLLAAPVQKTIRSRLVFPVAFPVTAAGLHSLSGRRKAGSKVCQEPRGDLTSGTRICACESGLGVSGAFPSFLGSGCWAPCPSLLQASLAICLGKVMTPTSREGLQALVLLPGEGGEPRRACQ